MLWRHTFPWESCEIGHIINRKHVWHFSVGCSHYVIFHNFCDRYTTSHHIVHTSVMCWISFCFLSIRQQFIPHLLILPSVLWHCWLGIRKSIRPTINGVVRCRRGHLSGARYKSLAYGPTDATATPSSLASLKSMIGLTFLVPAYPGSPGKEAVIRVSVCPHLPIYTVSQKKGATLTMAITLSILDRFPKFFHYCWGQ